MADSGGRPPGALESWTCWPGSGAVRGRLVVGAVPSPTRLPISFAESSYAVRLNVPELCKDCGGGRSDAAKHARPGPELWKTVRRAYSARERRARAPRTSAAHALAQVSRQVPLGTWMSGAPAPRRHPRDNLTSGPLRVTSAWLPPPLPGLSYADLYQHSMPTRQSALRSSVVPEGEDAIIQAVMAMKEAVDVAIQHGDIWQDAVCSKPA